MTTMVHKRFEAHLEPLLDAAYRMALHLCNDEDDAADLLQESALRAFRSFHTFEEGTNFRAWFFRIMTNLNVEWSRKRHREPVVALDSDLYLNQDYASEGPDHTDLEPAAQILDHLETEEVQRAIQALPDEYRMASMLYFIDELSYQEIADIVGCPVGTVRSRLHRGRRMLKRSLRFIAEQYGIVRAASA